MCFPSRLALHEITTTTARVTPRTRISSPRYRRLGFPHTTSNPRRRRAPVSTSLQRRPSKLSPEAVRIFCPALFTMEAINPRRRHRLCQTSMHQELTPRVLTSTAAGAQGDEAETSTSVTWAHHRLDVNR